MLKGTRDGILKKVQPTSIHGQVSLDVYYVEPDDTEGQVRIARVGKESIPRGLDAGDKVELHYVVGVVTHVTRG